MDIAKMTNKELLELVNIKQGLNRFYLYPELAKRASSSSEIEDILFEDIANKEKRNMELSPRGSIIKMAWIPLLELLLNSDESIKRKLKGTLKTWSDEEINSLRLYLKKHPDQLIIYKLKAREVEINNNKSIRISRMVSQSNN